MIKIINKFILKDNIVLKKACHLHPNLNLTYFFAAWKYQCLIIGAALLRLVFYINSTLNSKILILKILPEKKKDENYIIYHMNKFYNCFPRLGFILRTQEKHIVLNLYLLYLSNRKNRDY